jgi:hypothetical protein
MPNISKYPILEFVAAKRCEIKTLYNRITEVIFYNNTFYDKDNNKYILKEFYKRGSIEYHLYNDDDKEVSLLTLPETENLQDITFSDDTYIAAVPFKIFESNKREGHGASIFEGGKIDILDAIDETFSQYTQTIRMSSPKQYVPSSCIDIDVEGKTKLNSTIFNPFFVLESANPLENDDKIQTIQNALNSSEYGATLAQLITLFCSGLISPSSICIELQNQSLISSENSEAQREKEKQTLYTINKIKNALYETIPRVVCTVLDFYYMLYDNKRCDINEENITISMSEYANPSFESQIETIKKAAQEQTILTPEDIVEELYGNTLTKEEKEEKIRRLYIINYNVENIEQLLEQKAKIEQSEEL